MLRRLSIGVFASALAITPLPLNAHDGIADERGVGDQLNKPNIGLCDSLRGDDRQWDNTFTATIGSWKLTVRNSKKFHAGNITLLEKIKSDNFETNPKNLNTSMHTIAIDSGCPPHANRDISNAIKNTKQSFYLINTHAHHDHILGNSIFRDAGADIIAHINARKEMEALEDFDSSGLPNITFRDEMSLFVDDIVVRLIHLPSGHTNGDLAIWIPKLDILFTGDTFMTGGYPLIDLRSGTIRGLIKAVNAMIQIAGDNTLIIPGHGNLLQKANGSVEGPTREDLIQYLHMLITVTTEVEKLKQQGLSLLEINNRQPTQEFDQEWDNNLICSENFVSFVYNTLPGRKDNISPCSDIDRIDFSPPKSRSSILDQIPLRLTQTASSRSAVPAADPSDARHDCVREFLAEDNTAHGCWNLWTSPGPMSEEQLKAFLAKAKDDSNL